MNDRDIVELIRSEVRDCRDSRNNVLGRFETNVLERLEHLTNNQTTIKQMLETRLQHHETLAASADIAMRGQVDTKVSASMFRWAISILAAGLIGGSILNYATLRSVQSSLQLFNNSLDTHISESITRDTAEDNIIRQLIKDAREKHNIPIDPNIYIPSIKPPTTKQRTNEGE